MAGSNPQILKSVRARRSYPADRRDGSAMFLQTIRRPQDDCSHRGTKIPDVSGVDRAPFAINDLYAIEIALQFFAGDAAAP
jgi:hypothetical protein